MRINNPTDNRSNFRGLTALAKPLSTFYDANAVVPTLLIETGVTLGRANRANKRGGKVEATERLVEQGISALVWVFGVQVFKKIGEFFGGKILNVKDFNFDVGRDELRNPIKNNKIDSKIATFKAANILGATALATVFIGFVLPKINHFITNKALKKNVEQKDDKQKNIEQKSDTLLKPTSINQYQNDLKKKNNEISFRALNAVTLAHTLENNSAARLLVTDTGVISGRCYNGRNKYEKIENFFRDTASIYFYLRAPDKVTEGLNALSGNADIDPKALDETVEFIKNELKTEKMTPKEFREYMCGGVSKENTDKLEILFKDKKVISLGDFLSEFPEYKQKAHKMSELQPIFNDNRVLSKKQAYDVLSTGKLSDPEFLKKMINKTTNGVSDDPLRYISRKKLEKIREMPDKFIAQLENKAKDKMIDVEFVEKTANKNVAKNLIFRLGGLGFAAFVLGILIPKAQYAITKRLTQKNEFPGIQNYDETNKK